MIERKVYIERYDWTLCAYYAVTDYHTGHILADLQRIDCPEELQQRVEGNLRSKTMDSGFTYSNKRLRKTDRKSTRLNSSHRLESRMPSSA